MRLFVFVPAFVSLQIDDPMGATFGALAFRLRHVEVWFSQRLSKQNAR